MCVWKLGVCLIGLCECDDDDLCVCDLIVLAGSEIITNLLFQLTDGDASLKEAGAFKEFSSVSMVTGLQSLSNDLKWAICEINPKTKLSKGDMSTAHM